MKDQNSRSGAKPKADVVINIQDPRAIETQLRLSMESVASVLQQLDDAQHITQDRLQLEVSV